MKPESWVAIALVVATIIAISILLFGCQVPLRPQ